MHPMAEKQWYEEFEDCFPLDEKRAEKVMENIKDWLQPNDIFQESLQKH